MMKRAWALACLCLVLCGAAGCTPVIIPAGTAVLPPSIARAAFITADGARLPYAAWLPAAPPRAILLGLHGFGDYSVNAFDLPAPLFTAQGIAVFAYDQRGFGAAPNNGLWAGSATLAADATTVTRLLAARYPGVPIYLMGESMGAGVLLLAATSADPPPVAGYVLLAPGVRGRASMGGFAKAALEVASRTIPAVGFSGSAPGFSPTDNEAAMRRWSRDPLTAKLFRVDFVYGLVNLMDDALAAAPRFTADAFILYGGHDRIVPPGPIRQLLGVLPQGAPHRLGFYPQGHHLLLRDQDRATVAADILAWIADHAAALPSGADAAGSRWVSAAAE